MKETEFLCENCNARVAKNAKMCRKCGKFFHAVRCPKCGAVGNVEYFEGGCPECGYFPSSNPAKTNEENRALLSYKKASFLLNLIKRVRLEEAAKDEALPKWVYVVLFFLLSAVFSCAAFRLF